MRKDQGLNELHHQFYVKCYEEPECCNTAKTWINLAWAHLEQKIVDAIRGSIHRLLVSSGSNLGGQNGIADLVLTWSMDELAIQVSPLSLHSSEELLQNGVIDNAHHRDFVDDKADGDTDKGEPVDEVCGAVQGVDNPRRGVCKKWSPILCRCLLSNQLQREMEIGMSKFVRGLVTVQLFPK